MRRPHAFLDLPNLEALCKREHDILLLWIQQNVIPQKRPNRRHTSYGMKHLFEYSDNGFYVTNDLFKEAMQACGFKAVNPHDVNHYYRISERSECFQYD